MVPFFTIRVPWQRGQCIGLTSLLVSAFRCTIVPSLQLHDYPKKQLTKEESTLLPQAMSCQLKSLAQRIQHIAAKLHDDQQPVDHALPALAGGLVGGPVAGDLIEHGRRYALGEFFGDRAAQLV